MRTVRAAGANFHGGTRRLVVQEDASHDHTVRVSVMEDKMLASMIMQKTALIKFARDILEMFGEG